MSKILALDLGDKWVGTALSDITHLIARPFKTIEAENLIPFLDETFTKERIKTIVVGHPITLRGTKSEQTKKVETYVESLKDQFPDKTFRFWDERLTSKIAEQLKGARTKEGKVAAHSIAAAFILDSYLGYLAFSKTINKQ